MNRNERKSFWKVFYIRIRWRERERERERCLGVPDLFVACFIGDNWGSPTPLVL